MNDKPINIPNKKSVNKQTKHDTKSDHAIEGLEQNINQEMVAEQTQELDKKSENFVGSEQAKSIPKNIDQMAKEIRDNPENFTIAEAVHRGIAVNGAKNAVENLVRPPIYVAEGKAVCTSEGVLGYGSEIKAEYLKGGEESIERLIKVGSILRSA